MMNTKLSNDQELELELMPGNELTYQIDRLNLGYWFNQISEALFRGIFSTGEPIIEQVIDRKGQIHWQISDPTTRQIFYCSSEAEVRIWLERRYALK